MIKAVIFDCFGVLYIDAGAHFYETYVKDYDRLSSEFISLDRQTDYGLISQEDLCRAVADLSGLSFEFVSKHLQGIHRRNQKLHDYMGELRQTLRVAMLSNISPLTMDEFFTAEERRELFDAVVMSGEEGITKPHPRIYEIAAERLGVKTGECVMVDDIEDNCAGADGAGMKAIHYQSVDQLKRELQLLMKSSQ